MNKEFNINEEFDTDYDIEIDHELLWNTLRSDERKDILDWFFDGNYPEAILNMTSADLKSAIIEVGDHKFYWMYIKDAMKAYLGMNPDYYETLDEGEVL